MQNKKIVMEERKIQKKEHIDTEKEKERERQKTNIETCKRVNIFTWELKNTTGLV